MVQYETFFKLSQNMPDVLHLNEIQSVPYLNVCVVRTDVVQKDCDNDDEVH